MSRSLDTGSEFVIAEIDAGIAVITMNRPERKNALGPGMLDGIAQALRKVETDPEVHVVVLTGAGGSFCAGGDVKDFAEGGGAGGGEGSWDEGVHRQRLSHRETAGALYNMPKPTIAAMGGAAAGAGLSLALACDFRVAVETAVMTTAFARVGLSGDFGGTWFLTQLVGPSKAKELYMLPERMSMATALELGIVNKVASPDDYEATWRDMAARLASGPPIAYRYMKENINRAMDADVWTVMDLESTHHRHTGITEDHMEAARAFVEKREPRFKGR